MTIRVLIADDHRMLCEGLAAILHGQQGVEVVGEACDGHQTIELAARHMPDVVVMDVTMPGLNGIEATRRVVRSDPKVRVIGLSTHSDQRFILAMLEAGAVGYVLKEAASHELLDAVCAVHRGQRYLSPEIAGALLDGFMHRPRAGASERIGAVELASREREVLQLLAEGDTSKTIAARLGIAVSTVEKHRRNIMIKLKLHTIADLTKYAVRVGLTSLEA